MALQTWLHAQDTIQLMSSSAACKDWSYPNDANYDTLSNTPEGCMQRCRAKIPDTTAFDLTTGTQVYAQNQCRCSATTSGPCPAELDTSHKTYQIISGMHENEASCDSS